MVNCNLTLREPLSCHQGFCSIESKFAQATERRINTPIKTWQSRVRPQALSAGGHAVHHAAAPPPLRDVAGRVIKSNDLEESILLPSKGQVSTIRARSWHFHSLLVQKYWTKKIQWQKKKKKDTNQGHLKHSKIDPFRSIPIYHEDCFLERERQLAGAATWCRLSEWQWTCSS